MRKRKNYNQPPVINHRDISKLVEMLDSNPLEAIAKVEKSWSNTVVKMIKTRDNAAAYQRKLDEAEKMREAALVG